MGARDISGPMLRVCFGAVSKGVTPSKLLTWVLEEMATVERDLDMTGDVDSHYYYTGMSDAFEMVAMWIAPLKDDKTQAYFDLVNKINKPSGTEAAA